MVAWPAPRNRRLCISHPERRDQSQRRDGRTQDHWLAYARLHRHRPDDARRRPFFCAHSHGHRRRNSGIKWRSGFYNGTNIANVVRKYLRRLFAGLQQHLQRQRWRCVLPVYAGSSMYSCSRWHAVVNITSSDAPFSDTIAGTLKIWDTPGTLVTLSQEFAHRQHHRHFRKPQSLRLDRRHNCHHQRRSHPRQQQLPERASHWSLASSTSPAR